MSTTKQTAPRTRARTSAPAGGSATPTEASSAATAAGDGIPGTNTFESGSSDGAGASPAPLGAGGGDPRGDDALEDRARMAESLIPPGGSIADFAAGDASQVAVPPAAATLFEPVVTHLHVRALRDGHRRAGRRWPSAGEDVPIDAFTDTQVEALLLDPVLSVTPIAQQDAE